MANFDIPPSTILLPLPGDAAPADDVIRQILEEKYPGVVIEEADEDYPSDVPWMLAVDIPEWPETVYLWPERVDDLPAEAWWPNSELTDELRDAFESCGVGLVIETQLEGDDPRVLWRKQLMLALDLGDDAPFIYDDSAMRIVTRYQAESLMEVPVHPSAREMMALHAVYDEGDRDPRRLWLHTHGLERAGVANLEAFGVRGEHHQTAAHLIGLVADRQIDGLLQPGKPLVVAPGLTIGLIPLDQALKLVGPDEVGGPRDRDELHESPRMVLVTPGDDKRQGFSFFATPVRSLTLDAVLASLEHNDLIFYTTAETERMTYLARYRWPLFLSLWRQRRDHEWLFFVRKPFHTPNADVSSEHVWFEVTALEAERIEATLINTPMHARDLALGQHYDLQAEEITDWNISTEDGVYDPSSAVKLAVENGVQLIAPRPVH
ncbi:MAG: DUF4026 domain-containing protein [Myxococcales bacterium]|nr:MAG: DUF4026 domain-containing protein [Myxococcales bacterium]